MKIGLWRITPTACSAPVARERRRLLIEPARLSAETCSIALLDSERHYLRRVLRLRIGDQVDVVNGQGDLWTVTLDAGDRLLMAGDSNRPQRSQPRPTPLLGLAVALIRRDSDVWIRMACELGIDRIQPVLADRCVPQAERREDRWQTIVHESVEQCERLWAPTLLPAIDMEAWLDGVDGRVAMAVTREESTPELSTWLVTDPSVSPTWLLVGPEGGWSQEEHHWVETGRVQPVALGDNILRSSTAAVRGAVEMVRWRESHCRA